MNKMILGLAVAFGLGAVACGNPCDKLAKAVCDKAKDQKICDSFTAKAKSMDKNVCKEQIKTVDAIVLGLQAVEKAKDVGKNLLQGLGNKLMDGLNKAVGNVPAPAPAPAP